MWLKFRTESILTGTQVLEIQVPKKCLALRVSVICIAKKVFPAGSSF